MLGMKLYAIMTVFERVSRQKDTDNANWKTRDKLHHIEKLEAAHEAKHCHSNLSPHAHCVNSATFKLESFFKGYNSKYHLLNPFEK